MAVIMWSFLSILGPAPRRVAGSSYSPDSSPANGVAPASCGDGGESFSGMNLTKVRKICGRAIVDCEKDFVCGHRKIEFSATGLAPDFEAVGAPSLNAMIRGLWWREG